jgi:hypothetical protein
MRGESNRTDRRATSSKFPVSRIAIIAGNPRCALFAFPAPILATLCQSSQNDSELSSPIGHFHSKFPSFLEEPNLKGFRDFNPEQKEIFFSPSASDTGFSDNPMRPKSGKVMTGKQRI